MRHAIQMWYACGAHRKNRSTLVSTHVQINLSLVYVVSSMHYTTLCRPNPKKDNVATSLHAGFRASLWLASPVMPMPPPLPPLARALAPLILCPRPLLSLFPCWLRAFCHTERGERARRETEREERGHKIPRKTQHF